MNSTRLHRCAPRRVTVSAAFLMCIFVASAPVVWGDDTAPRWVEIRPGVYAVLQPEPLRFNDSNSLVVASQDGILVVDAQANQTYVRQLIDEIERRFDAPVQTVVNTHWHGDHTQGNEVYRERFAALQIVAHETVGDDMRERAKPQLDEEMDQLATAIEAAERRLEQGLSDDGATLTSEEKDDLQGRIERAHVRLQTGRNQKWVFPTRTVAASDTLLVGGRRIVLLHARAHTRGDVVVFLPDQKVLVTGDILDDLPFGGHGYPSEWLATLRRLEALDFETIVPGHGQIRQGKEHLQLVVAMLEEIVAATRGAAEAGKTLEETQVTLDLKRFREALVVDDTSGRAFDSFIPETIERAFLEARGELPHDR